MKSKPLSRLVALLAVAAILLGLAPTMTASAAAKKKLVNFGCLNQFGKVPEGLSTEELFEHLKAELPSELPIVDPQYPAKRTYLYVSPTGSDKNDGSEKKPFATLEKAVSVARKSLDKDYTIYLRGGVYNPGKTTEIVGVYASAEHPLVIAAYPGEEVILTRGESLSPSKIKKVSDPKVKARFNKTVADDICEIDLSALGKINDFSHTWWGGVPSVGASLTIDGQLYTVARYPDVGRVDISEVLRSSANGGFTFRTDDPTPYTWGKNNVHIWGGLYIEWAEASYPVTIDNEKKTVDSGDMASVGGYGIRVADGNGVSGQVIFMNVLEELTRPGEYYVDTAAKKLYFLPYEKVRTDSKILLTTDESFILDVGGCNDIIFENIIFEGAEARGLNLENCEEIIFDGCTVRGMSGQGVWVTDCQRSGFVNSSFYDIVGCYLRFTYDYYDIIHYTPSNNFLQNSTIVSDEKSLYSQVGWGGLGDVCSHNYFANANYACLGLDNAWEFVCEYNEFVSSQRGLNDYGYIYGGGRFYSQKYAHIRYNYFHNSIPATESIRETSIAIYFDDQSAWNFAYGNVMYQVDTAVYTHGGWANVAADNLMIDGSSKGNAVYISEHNNPDTYDVIARLNTDYVTVTNGIRRRCPDYAEYLTTMIQFYISRKKNSSYTPNKEEAPLFVPQNHVVRNNIQVNCRAGMRIDPLAFETIMMHGNLVYHSDPGFKDMANKNFALRSDSEIFDRLTDFEAPPFEKMGLLSESSLKQNKPVLLSPVNGKTAEIADGQIRLIWKESYLSSTYRVEVATDAAFQKIVFTGIAYRNRINVPVEMQKTYYWRVTALPIGRTLPTTETTSAVSSFTTKKNETAAPIGKHLYTESEWDAAGYDIFVFNFIDGDGFSKGAEFYVGCNDSGIYASQEIPLSAEHPRAEVRIPKGTEKDGTFAWSHFWLYTVNNGYSNEGAKWQCSRPPFSVDIIVSSNLAEIDSITPKNGSAYRPTYRKGVGTLSGIPEGFTVNDVLSLFENPNLAVYSADGKVRKNLEQVAVGDEIRLSFHNKVSDSVKITSFAGSPETDPPETKEPETKSPETKSPETKSPETKSPETKSPETKSPETKSPETKTEETTPTETEPIESLPVETKPEETESEQTSTAATEPEETAVSESKPETAETEASETEEPGNHEKPFPVIPVIIGVVAAAGIAFSVIFFVKKKKKA